MIEALMWALWIVGGVVLGYGVFAAPSIGVENWYQKDRPYQKVRMVGAALIFTMLMIALITFKQ